MNDRAPAAAAAMAVTEAQNSGRPNNSSSTSTSSAGFKQQQQMKGVRLRKWGRWVAEIRMPKTRQKIWLGSYHTRDEAALAYDAALYCLRGPTAKFNFPARLPDIPAASSLSRAEIQAAAAKYALGQLPALPRPAKNKSSSSSNSSTSAAAEKFSGSSSPSWSGSSEIAGTPPPAALLDDDVDVWAAIFGNPAPQHENSGNDARNYGGGGGLLNLDKVPSLDVMEMENYLFPVPSPVPAGQPSAAFADDLSLWDFGEF